jgi:hypothetical protein
MKSIRDVVALEVGGGDVQIRKFINIELGTIIYTCP